MNNNPNIDNVYVDGVSITYDSSPCKHIWTLGVGVVDNVANGFCGPCNTNTGSVGATVPAFVGNDYYCESGIASSIYYGIVSTLYPSDPLWDG